MVSAILWDWSVLRAVLTFPFPAPAENRHQGIMVSICRVAHAQTTGDGMKRTGMQDDLGHVVDALPGRIRTGLSDAHSEHAIEERLKEPAP
jgi:hypothetical protein